MALNDIVPAPLEDWLRDRYFDLPLDISGSGVQDYSLGELRERLGIPVGELDALVFRDSPSLGCLPLRELIARRVGTGRPDRIMVTHGSTEALFLALTALVRPGDEIVVLRPAYQSLSSIAEALGARLVPWILDPADGFRPDLERLRAALTARTRAVVVNFPHNPTGTTLGHDQYAELLGLLEGHPCHLLWDAASADLTYRDAPLPDPSASLPRVISVGTLSKAYGLPGLRVGWCSAPAGLVEDMVRIRDYVSISTSPLAELLATAVLRDPEALLRPRLRQAAANREVLLGWAVDNADLVALPEPLGGVAAFPAVLGGLDSDALCHALERRGALAVPGSCFGHPDRMRIGFGGHPEQFRNGLDLLVDTMRQRHPSPSGATS
ncbi:capreomycidine synthase [Amycolatopsis sp. NPDC088138]|uniref:capreomycidine synthase n=1 Tax=Amycolatopsis sp. NPDC088138 TaxID=3363938 RepID=UPI00380D1F5B